MYIGSTGQDGLVQKDAAGIVREHFLAYGESHPEEVDALIAAFAR